MSVVKTSLLSQQGTINEEGGQYTLVYWVKTDDRYDGPNLVMGAPGWTYLDPYIIGNDSDPTAFCIDISADQMDKSNPFDWAVNVEFGQPESEKVDNPLNEPIEEVWSFSNNSEDIAVDVNGNPIVNTASDFLATQRNNNQPIVTFTRNEPTVNQPLIMANKDSVNSKVWRGFAPRTVKVANITNTRQYDTYIGYYWKTSYSFEINTDTWRFRPLNAGLREIKGGKLQPIYVRGEAVTEPVPLKPDGSSARNDSGVLTANPYLLEFQLYPEVDFNQLFIF